MGLHNIRHGPTCFNLFHPRLSCYNRSYKGVIGFSLISNPGELGPIRALAKRDRLLNTQELQVELSGVEMNKRCYFINSQLETYFGLTEINACDQILCAFDIQVF